MTLEFMPTRSQLELLAQHLERLLRARNDEDVFDDVLTDFLHAIHASGFMVPYDWPTYVATREAELKDPGALPSMDAENFQRFVIAHVRTDHFVEGHLRHLAESGYLAAVAARARELGSAM